MGRWPVETAQTIGIRELRQHASRYVDLAATGRAVQVTKRGKVVAYIVGAPDAEEPLADLIATGMVALASDPHDLADVEPVRLDAGQVPPSVALQQMRDDERW